MLWIAYAIAVDLDGDVKKIESVGHYRRLMLAFLTGFCFGVAVGWISYIQRESIASLAFIYTIPILIILYRVVAIPTAVAAGAMDMGFFEFVVFAIEFYFSDGLTNIVNWLLLGAVIGWIGALAGYKGFEPEPLPPETREESRRRVRADMKYSDDYFD